MNLLNLALQILDRTTVAFFVTIAALVHLSLFFCNESHCWFYFEEPPLSNQLAYFIRSLISALLPLFQFKLIQIFAHILVVLEIVIPAYIIYNQKRRALKTAKRLAQNPKKNASMKRQQAIPQKQKIEQSMKKPIDDQEKAEKAMELLISKRKQVGNIQQKTIVDKETDLIKFQNES